MELVNSLIIMSFFEIIEGDSLISEILSTSSLFSWFIRFPLCDLSFAHSVHFLHSFQVSNKTGPHCLHFSHYFCLSTPWMSPFDDEKLFIFLMLFAFPFQSKQYGLWSSEVNLAVLMNSRDRLVLLFSERPPISDSTFPRKQHN